MAQETIQQETERRVRLNTSELTFLINALKLVKSMVTHQIHIAQPLKATTR